MFVKLLPAVVAFEALGGVDCAAECRHGVDADLFEFVPVAVERRLVRHAGIHRIPQRRILLRDVPAVHAHLPPGGNLTRRPPSQATLALKVCFALAKWQRDELKH